jgi:tetratricopeptide (TPR) repeat protein
VHHEQLRDVLAVAVQHDAVVTVPNVHTGGEWKRIRRLYPGEEVEGCLGDHLFRADKILERFCDARDDASSQPGYAVALACWDYARPLLHKASETGAAGPYRARQVIVDHVREHEPLPGSTTVTWARVVDQVEAWDLLDVAVAAVDQGNPEIAKAAWGAGRRFGALRCRPQANVYLGDLLRRAGRVDDAEAAYRAALDSGHPKAATDAAWRFAQLAAGQSKIDEADDWHRQAVARSGDELRLVDEVELGRQFEGAGRHARAETLYRRIQETPDASLRATAQSGQSLAALMATVEYATPGRQPSSSTTRGGVMAGRSIGPRRNDSTRSSSRHSTRSSEGRTALAIADLAIARGDWGEAEEKLELVVELRHEEYAPEAALRLGRRYIQTGRFPDARRVLRQVARYKDPEALREAAEELRGIEGMGPPDPPPAPPTGPPDAPGPARRARSVAVRAANRWGAVPGITRPW